MTDDERYNTVKKLKESVADTEFIRADRIFDILGLDDIFFDKKSVERLIDFIDCDEPKQNTEIYADPCDYDKIICPRCGSATTLSIFGGTDVFGDDYWSCKCDECGETYFFKPTDDGINWHEIQAGWNNNYIEHHK